MAIHKICLILDYNSTKLINVKIYANNYFWRTWDQQEIDFVEERGGKLFAYEFKYSKDKVKTPKEFLITYPNFEFSTVTSKNYLDFIT